MKVSNVMTRSVRSVRPDDSIHDVAALMGTADVGFLAVIQDGQVVGVITDRDIVLRGVAAGVDPAAPIAGIMTRKVQGREEFDDLDQALDLMATQKVRRLVVRDGEGKVTGLVSIGDIARCDWDKDEVGATLGELCRPCLHNNILAK